MKILLKPNAMYEYRSRPEVDISRDELARRMKVTPQTAYRVERGDVDPSPKFIAGLISVTGLPFEALFQIVDEVKDAA